MPRGAASLAAYNVAVARFGIASAIEPSFMMGIVRDEDSRVLDAVPFSATGAASRAIAAASPGTMVTSVAYIGSSMGDVPLSLATWALNQSCPRDRSCAAACPEFACIAQKGVAQTISADGRTVLILLRAPWDTFTKQGYDWSLQMRALAANQSAHDAVLTWTFVGGVGCMAADFVAAVYGLLPWVGCVDAPHSCWLVFVPSDSWLRALSRAAPPRQASCLSSSASPFARSSSRCAQC